MKLYTEDEYPRNYPQFTGETPFEKAVNEVISDNWVETGRIIPMEAACWEVMADLYNEVHQDKPM